MPTLPNDIISTEEIIKDWTCRENGAIFVPKEDRKRAFLMQVDIKIVSVARYQYLNYETSPPDSYYGYATLVMRDYVLPPIKLTQPRQTIYLERNYDAIDCWHQYFRAIEQQPRFQGVEELICGVVAQLGGACVAKDCVPVKPPPFIELPLREVYINCHVGTQFQIELSYWRFLPLTDNCGNLVPFESGQEDSDKDNGLPPNGTMPAQAPIPDNPYLGLPPASTPQDSPLGLLPTGKQDNLGDTNPDNSTAPTDGQEDGRSYNVTVQFGVDYYNGSNAKVGSSTGEVYFAVVIGKIRGIYENPSKEIRNGDYVGIVSQDVLILDKNGLLAGSLGSTNIFPPYPGSVGATKWQLFGITGYSIVPN
jgi:hypothetical protein